MNVGQLKAELERLPDPLEVFFDTEEAPDWVEIDAEGIYPCRERVELEAVRFEGSFVRLEP